MRSLSFAVVCIAGAIGFTAPALATEQIYHPVSPTFGGNPLNGSFLLSTAQAQGPGARSGSQSPDLSGLTSALSNTGAGSSSSPIVIIGGNGLPTVPKSP